MGVFVAAATAVVPVEVTVPGWIAVGAVGGTAAVGCYRKYY